MNNAEIRDEKTQTIQWITTGILLILGFYNRLAQIKNWPHIEIVDAQITAYVTWFYELIVGAWAFWFNNNISPGAKLAQLVLNALKRGSLSEGDVETFLNNNTVQQMVSAINEGKVTNNQLSTLLNNSESALKYSQTKQD